MIKELFTQPSQLTQLDTKEQQIHSQLCAEAETLASSNPHLKAFLDQHYGQMAEFMAAQAKTLAEQQRMAH